MADILVIDDEEEILAIVKEALETDHHRVSTKQSVTEISENTLHRFDLVILDVMMPDVNGFSWCHEIRKFLDIPVLFLTAKTATADLVEGLSVGGDDYLTKPFLIDELRARVNAHLRREKREKRVGLKFGEIYINLKAKEILVSNEKVPLTKSEYDICAFLAKHVGQVFSKDQLYDGVFGYEGESQSSVISEHIKNIRAKFRQYGLSPINTVWGIGYKWT